MNKEGRFYLHTRINDDGIEIWEQRKQGIYYIGFKWKDGKLKIFESYNHKYHKSSFSSEAKYFDYKNLSYEELIAWIL